MSDRSALPLSGVRVLDFSRVLAGPLCGMVLGDFGADVIKVEHPGRGDDTRDWGLRIGRTETAYFNSVNRNKRSIALDLQDAGGPGDRARAGAGSATSWSRTSSSAAWPGSGSGCRAADGREPAPHLLLDLGLRLAAGPRRRARATTCWCRARPG